MSGFSLDNLLSGIKDRQLSEENSRLINKWSRMGLLRGLEGVKRENMARLLENQAAQVLRESASLSTGGGSGLSSGQIQGFSNIAFPIVRRVFGGLVANELISIQPMSLPSGLIFYLDYTYGSNVGGDQGVDLQGGSTATYPRGESIYNNPRGKGIQSGSLATGGMYDLVNTGYSKLHNNGVTANGSVVASSFGAWVGAAEAWTSGSFVNSSAQFTGSNALNAQFDMQIDKDIRANAFGAGGVFFLHAPVSGFSAFTTMDTGAYDQIAITAVNAMTGSAVWGEAYQTGNGVLNLRRLTRRGNWDAGTGVFTPNPMNGTHYQFVMKASTTLSALSGNGNLSVSYAVADNVTALDTPGAVLTVPTYETDFGGIDGSPVRPVIPEIDIKIESIAITATTRKLRARWSPELAQDLNAYHSMDAEVELTQILSEQIALEIDREILADILTQANGANYYWSKAPGKFLDKNTGREARLTSSLSVGPTFTGTVREWYETLTESVIDVANTIHRKTLRGSANFIVTSPDVATILEASVLYRPKYSMDGEGQVGNPMTIGCEPVGTLSNRFTVYKDPYFPRNKLLVGFKGGSYLETGYVYAPYVPLIVTPTIFAPEDLTPRKGIMTRYGKKMVRSDFYGTVTILDMNIR